jgi:methyl coenzyme M reductase alpha subunit
VVVELTSKGTKVLESYDEMFLRLATQTSGKVSADVLAAAAACLEAISTMELQPAEA